MSSYTSRNRKTNQRYEEVNGVEYCPSCKRKGWFMKMVKDGHFWRCRLCGYKVKDESK